METHTIRSGETLSAVAHRYGTTWQAIAHLNAITNPNQLVVGRRLKLPAHSPHHHPPILKPSPHRPGSSPLENHKPSETPETSPQPGSSDGVTESHLHAIMPNANSKAATFLAPLNSAMRAYGIDTHEKHAAFLAQISVESGDLRNTEENLNYSAERLHQVWPKRFRTLAAAQPYAHNPEALGNHVYANRLGNGDEASGDGYRFRGRGLMQTTGRDNYRAAGYENQPDDLANPSVAADSAARFWSSNGLNPRSSAVLARGSFDTITQTVNGGLNGSDERWAAYGRAVTALGLTPHQ